MFNPTYYPIEAGVDYTGSVEMYLEDGSASFFLRYFDEAGKQVGSDKDGVNIIHIRSGHGKWQTVNATVQAPEGAKYARLFAGASNFFTTKGAYYDDFQLTYEKEVAPVEPEPEKSAELLLEELSGQLDEYINSNEVRGPLINQLQNSLKQAEHHLNKGSEQKASDFVEKFLKHMNNKPMQHHINETAKADLAQQADNLLKYWKK